MALALESAAAVAQGYAVAMPNPRGSTGFGQDFIQGIWGNVWGEQCYQDLMAVTDALRRAAISTRSAPWPWADPSAAT